MGCMNEFDNFSQNRFRRSLLQSSKLTDVVKQIHTRTSVLHHNYVGVSLFKISQNCCNVVNIFESLQNCNFQWYFGIGNLETQIRNLYEMQKKFHFWLPWSILFYFWEYVLKSLFVRQIFASRHKLFRILLFQSQVQCHIHLLVQH